MLHFKHIILDFLNLIDHDVFFMELNKPMQIIRLARKLPTGDLKDIKIESSREEEEPLDENDLT